MKSSIITLFVGIVCFTIKSAGQQVIFTTSETDWQLTPTIAYSPRGTGDFYGRTLQHSVIPVDKGHVVPVQFQKKEFGLVLIDNKGNTKWRTITKGFVTGVAKLNEHVICFYSPEWNSAEPAKAIGSLYAGVYDVTSGKQVVEKVVFQNRTEWYVDPKVLVTPDLQFAQVLLRHSQYVNSKLFTARETEKLLTTEKISIITINGSHDFKVTDLPSQAVQNRFITCSALSATDFVIASENDDVLTTERFNVNDLSNPRKYKVSMSMSDRSFPDGIIRYNNLFPENLYISLCFFGDDKNKRLALLKLNLGTGKHSTEQIELNEELAESFAVDSKKQANRLKRNIRSMELVDLVIQNNRVLLLTQVHAIRPRGTENSFTVVNDEIMITQLDSEMKSKRSMIVDRKYEIFLASGEKFSYYITDEKMHMLYNVNNGVARAGAEYAFVDLANFTVIQQQVLERNGLRGDATIEPQAVIWSHETAIIPYNNMSGTKNGETIFQQIKLKK